MLCALSFTQIFRVFKFFINLIVNSFINLFKFLPAPLEIDRTNPNWIGAWWLGFLLCGVLYLLSSVPLFMFPIRVPDKERLAHKLHPQDFPEHQGLYDSPDYEPEKKKTKKKSNISCGSRTLSALKGT